MVGGRLALVVVIHETGVNVNTIYWRHIALELSFPHSLMQFYREISSSALWLLCADEIGISESYFADESDESDEESDEEAL